MTEQQSWQDYEVGVSESKGILDVTQEYTFELTEAEVKQGVIFHKDAPKELKGKLLEDLDTDERKTIKEKWCGTLFEMHFNTVDEGVDVELKEANWIDRLTINTSNPEYQSRLLTIIEKMGHSLDSLKETVIAKESEIGEGDGVTIKTIKLGDYFKVGMQFKAHVKPQLDKQKKETGYHELDLNTVKAMGSKPQKQNSFTEVTEAVKEKVLFAIQGSNSKDNAMELLVANKKTSLIGAFLAMVESGEIGYAKK